MVKRPRRFLASSLTFYLLVASTASGVEVYVVRFLTGTPAPTGPNCEYLYWQDEMIFHNTGDAPASVRLISVSNGARPANPEALPIGPRTTRTSDGDASILTGTWGPTPPASLWVAHLDVPDGILAVSRASVRTFAGCNPFPGPSGRTFAGVPMPVVRELTPPGVRSVHLGVDLGGTDTAGPEVARTNVGIYNAGAATASAFIELRQACDDSVVTNRSLSIPANSIVQTRMDADVFEGCNGLNAAGYDRYVVVTVDQPSLSYSISLSNQRPPWFPVVSSP